MLLKSIHLKNFRQFKGNQNVEFSLDQNKNVSIIMGENGSGKTTLAQAFTWCLYGDTDFEDKNVINKIAVQDMDKELEVNVGLYLDHNNTEYKIERSQTYIKDRNGKETKPSSSDWKINFKDGDGQWQHIKPSERDFRLKEILPKELSKYFFFDGERIGNMSKEIRKGKSKEFAQAVRNLLGLSAFIAALDHLKGRGINSVIKHYEKCYSSNTDKEIAVLTNEVNKFTNEIEKIDTRLEEIENDNEIAKEQCSILNIRIQQNKESEKIAEERDKQTEKLKRYQAVELSQKNNIIKRFNNESLSFFMKKMIKDALTMLSENEKIDKGIPDIHARTIDFLIKRGRCICGEEITINNDRYKELHKVLDYIPPQSIGTLIAQFVKECEIRSKSSDSFYENISSDMTILRDYQKNIGDTSYEIDLMTNKLLNMTSVKQDQIDLLKYEKILQDNREEEKQLIEKKGAIKKEKDEKERQRQEHSLKDENNKKIEIYKCYAEQMYERLNELYKQKELETKDKLQENVNKIFKQIYDGGFSLSLDDKYNIQIIADGFHDTENEIETSTAQSNSIIFAFISGVIKMAKENNSNNEGIKESEPYPLVMDAPLSSFDKTRIKTVCDVIPKIAEQVIIFIKDTDGEIAENNMLDRIGKRYYFDKKNEFETYIVEK